VNLKTKIFYTAIDTTLQASEQGIFPRTPKIQKGVFRKPQAEPLDTKWSYLLW